MNHDLIGLLPAAGKASRIQPLPCSKELMPIGFQTLGPNRGRKTLRPKAVSQYLLESLQCAGVRKAYVIINRSKWDIPAYYGPGTLAGIHLAYVVTDCPYGAPFSLRQAFPFVSNATILFGFPDIRFAPMNSFTRLLARKAETRSDLVLGLFRAKEPSKMDMVRLDRCGNIKAIDIKPLSTSLTYTWIIAVWSPVFTAFMQTYLDEVESELQSEHQQTSADSRAEFYVGYVIQAAIDSGLRIATVIFEKGEYIDIGTPECLVSAMTGSITPEEK